MTFFYLALARLGKNEKQLLCVKWKMTNEYTLIIMHLLTSSQLESYVIYENFMKQFLKIKAYEN